ncbi:hypothetical protein [Anaerocolumna sp.]|uniref:hypothetical protein n=1 Tax=Anaerocolumna sp. TaxID=2041569 RepID=UPI0028ACD6EF|nr:hypothetical protein [Anaerocolumna sp.]
MSNFFDIVSFEYKKLFKRKSTIISLLLLVIIAAFLAFLSVKSHFYWHESSGRSSFEAMKLDREVIRSKAGVMDEAFIKEVIEQNTIMIFSDENYYIDHGRRVGSKSYSYIKYVLPYEKAADIINSIYEVNTNNLGTDGFQIINTSEVKPIDTLTVKEGENFYNSINQASTEHINSLSGLSQKEREKHFEMLSKVKTTTTIIMMGICILINI